MVTRVHRSLRVEELEPRTSPVVLNAAAPIYTFSDRSSDLVQIQFRGPGSAEVLWEGGGVTPLANDDIASITFFNTTQQTMLTLRDMNRGVGGDGITGGDVTTAAANDSLGILRIQAVGGWVTDTNIQVGGNLGQFVIQGNVGAVDVVVGGNVGQAQIQGPATDFVMAAMGAMAGFRVTGPMANCNISAAMSLGQVIVNGDCTGSVIQSGGNVSLVRITGNVMSSAVRSRDLTQLMINGGIVNELIVQAQGTSRSARMLGFVQDSVLFFDRVGSVAVGSLSGSVLASVQGPIQSLQCMGSMINSTVTSWGDCRSVRIGGQLRAENAGDEAIIVNGNLGQLFVGNFVLNPTIRVTGNVNALRFQQTVRSTTLDLRGAVGQLSIGGDVAGANVNIGGNTGSFTARAGVFDSTLAFGGTMGVFRVAGDAARDSIQIVGQATSIQFGGLVGATNIEARVGVGCAIFRGRVSAGSRLQIGGPSGMAQMRGEVADSTLTFVGAVNNLQFMGGLNNTEVTVAGDAPLFRVAGGIHTGSDVAILGSVRNLFCLGGVRAGSGLRITGNVTTCRITDGVALVSSLNIGGAVNTAMITARAGEAAVDFSTVLLGSLQRSLTLTGGIEGRGRVEIVGAADTARMSIQGDMAGRIAPAIFGNVVISGVFTGTLGSPATQAGVGNTLRVGTWGAGWTINPADAFAFFA
ncbi:MAG: hypothetical protein AB1696_04180 [Planctomycetota bacterium]